MSRSPFKPVLVAVVIAGHLWSTTKVWHDIDRRSPSELRGSKTLWRILTALNSGNHLLYLLVGRRRTDRRSR